MHDQIILPPGPSHITQFCKLNHFISTKISETHGLNDLHGRILWTEGIGERQLSKVGINFACGGCQEWLTRLGLGLVDDPSMRHLPQICVFSSVPIVTRNDGNGVCQEWLTRLGLGLVDDPSMRHLSLGFNYVLFGPYCDKKQWQWLS